MSKNTIELNIKELNHELTQVLICLNSTTDPKTDLAKQFIKGLLKRIEGENE